jgi:hypothetical protein
LKHVWLHWFVEVGFHDGRHARKWHDFSMNRVDHR